MTFVVASGETSGALDVTAFRAVTLPGVGESTGAGILTHSKVTPPNVIELGSSGEVSGTSDLQKLTKHVLLIGSTETSLANTVTTSKRTTLLPSTEISGSAVSLIFTKRYTVISSGESVHAVSNYKVPFKRYYGEYHVLLSSDIQIDMTGAF